jgi:hypothetical protein
MKIMIASTLTALVLASGAFATTPAAAMTSAACTGSSFTTHGLWDCR